MGKSNCPDNDWRIEGAYHDSAFDKNTLYIPGEGRTDDTQLGFAHKSLSPRIEIELCSVRYK